MVIVTELFNKIELNESHDISMVAITEQLFNNEFMSNIQFCIDDKVLFAHSWELMKRSVVFRNEMRETICDTISILIPDTSYAAFYQFIRFLYTDKCDINVDNHIELIKLARQYKVYKLETQILNSPIFSVKLFEYCVLEKYDLAYQMACERVAENPKCIKDILTTTSVDVIEEFLKFDYLNGVKEFEMFELLMIWMNKTCELQQIPLTERRSHFDKLFRLIRFSTFTLDEFSDCAKRHKDLFTNDDMLVIFKQISFGPGGFEQSPWNSKPRLPISYIYQSIKGYETIYQTKFTVSTSVTLSGLRFGKEFYNRTTAIRMIAQSSATETGVIKIKCNLEACSDKYSGLISLGDVIVLKPNIDYIVENEINVREKLIYVLKDPILTGPPDIIQISERSGNLVEIIYKIQD